MPEASTACIYGVPFSIIPFKGQVTESKAPEDKPKKHVHSDPGRVHYEIRFPVVEGYAFALKQNLVRADIDKMQGLVSAVNRWGKLGQWDFHVCRNPQMLGKELEELNQAAVSESVA